MSSTDSQIGTPACTSNHVGTAALGGPAERSSAIFDPAKSCRQRVVELRSTWADEDICPYGFRADNPYFGGAFGGISAYPGVACARFLSTEALASPIDQRIPPASRFRKNVFDQFSGRSPIAV